jgi:hypothetical protein
MGQLLGLKIGEKELNGQPSGGWNISRPETVSGFSDGTLRGLSRQRKTASDAEKTGRKRPWEKQRQISCSTERSTLRIVPTGR